MTHRDNTVARCYAAVMGVDWDTVVDWFVDGTELVLVVDSEKEIV